MAGQQPGEWIWQEELFISIVFHPQAHRLCLYDCPNVGCDLATEGCFIPEVGETYPFMPSQPHPHSYSLAPWSPSSPSNFLQDTMLPQVCDVF